MYDKSDPRAALAQAGAKKKAEAPSRYFGSEYGLFYATDPQLSDAGGDTWITRGEAFVVALTQAKAGGVFARSGQPDEYVLLLPEAETAVEITTAAGTERVEGMRIAFIPPGDSSVKMLTDGCIVRLFTPKSADIAAQAANAASFAGTHPTVPPFVAWPEPKDGLKLHHYPLDVPETPGRFGRIYRCTTFMVNYLYPRTGPRDRTKVSPHAHDDFEQCSLALQGRFIHHLRWPWTPDMGMWIEDEHVEVGAPSVAVIPPPAIHTTTSEDPGVNQLVDIFAPPRMDFSSKPGWVLNEADYPMPGA
jgi:hypothetical protein